MRQRLECASIKTRVQFHVSANSFSCRNVFTSRRGKSRAPVPPQKVEAEVTLKGGRIGIGPCLMEVWKFPDHYLWLIILYMKNDITTHHDRHSIIATRQGESGFGYLVAPSCQNRIIVINLKKLH